MFLYPKLFLRYMICRKSPILTYPTSIWAFVESDPVGISSNLWRQKTILGYRTALMTSAVSFTGCDG